MNNKLGLSVVEYIETNFLEQWLLMVKKQGLTVAMEIVCIAIGDVNSLVQELGTLNEEKTLKHVYDIDILTRSVSDETLNLMVKKISNRILNKIDTLRSKVLSDCLKRANKITDIKSYMQSIKHQFFVHSFVH